MDVGDRLPRGQVQEFFGGGDRERERGVHCTIEETL